MPFQFHGELWMHGGEAAWYFVTLPLGIADEIDERTIATRRGFGSVRVASRIGSTSWATSIFPDAAAQSFVLPVKKEVRVAEGLADGDQVVVTLELADLTAAPE